MRSGEVIHGKSIREIENTLRPVNIYRPISGLRFFIGIALHRNISSYSCTEADGKIDCAGLLLNKKIKFTKVSLIVSSFTAFVLMKVLPELEEQ